MAAQVLDSYALLAYLRDEAGADTVQTLLERASRRNAPLHMTEVNYAEVKYMTLRKVGAQMWAEVGSALASLPIEFHPATRDLAELAADFKSRHKISLADAFAAALAREKKGELISGDPAFRPLENEIKIAWLREDK